MRLQRNTEELEVQAAVDRLADDVEQANRPIAACVREFWQALGAGGWLAIALPAERGFLGGSATDIAAIMQAGGRVGLVTPFLSSLLTAGRLLAAAPPEPRLGDILQRAAAGEITLAALADGAWATHMPVRATPQGAGWHLAGSVPFCLGAAEAAYLVVQAGLPDAATGWFLLENATPGMQLRAYPTLRGEPAAAVSLDVVLPPTARLGIDAAAGMAIMDQACAAACWEAVGAMQYLLRATADYVQMRKQFGKPLAALQVMQHRIAEMAVQVELARAAALLASLATSETARAVAQAKLACARAARHVGQAAVQAHGGMGVTEELPVGRYFRLLTAFESLCGSTAQHQARYWQVAGANAAHRASPVLG